MVRGCALIASRLDTAKICSDKRVHVDHAQLPAVFGGEKTFSHGLGQTRKYSLGVDVFRGRDASYLAPPAQIRTSPIRAYGLYGAFFVKEASRHFCRPLSFHSFVRPAPQAFFRPDRIFASPSRAAAVKDRASSPPPKASP